MTDPRRANRLWLIAPWALFLLIIVGWSAYWLALKREALAQVDQIIAAQTAQGADASYGAVRAGGYPLRLSLRFEELRYAPADRAWVAAVPRLTLHINPTNPLHLIATPQAPISLRGSDGVAHVFEAETAALSLRFDTKGHLQRASFDAKDLTIAKEGEPAGSRLGAVTLHVRPDPRAPEQLQLALDFAQARLPRPVPSFEALGADIAELHARATLPRPQTQGLGARLQAVTQAPLQLEALSVAWGPAAFRAEGALGLDNLARPDGALTLRLENAGVTLTALGYGELATAAPSGASLTLPLAARSGALYLGPVAVRELKPLF